MSYMQPSHMNGIISGKETVNAKIILSGNLCILNVYEDIMVF